MRTEKVNVAIVGGGIAGLWSACALKSRGYSVALFCNTPLGAGQTLASQGVIHGGAKYAVGGKATDSSKELAAMPEKWREAIAGKGDVDLRGIKVLSDHQILWSLPGVTSQVLTFFGSNLMRGQACPISKKSAPEPLQSPKYKGRIFRIEEPVLDPVSLVEKLEENLSENCFLANCTPVKNEEGGSGISHLLIEEKGLTVSADFYIFAAGAGNAELLKQAGVTSPEMQLRPLHQLIIRGDRLPGFFSVCIGNGLKPPVVTTTHTDSKGRKIWWIGGDIAEADGVARSGSEQIAAGQALWKKILPGMKWDQFEWFTARADRAEPLTGTGDRPSGAFCERKGNLLVCWPTKLALAPDLADKILREIEAVDISLGSTGKRLPLPGPGIGHAPWDLD